MKRPIGITIEKEETEDSDNFAIIINFPEFVWFMILIALIALVIFAVEKLRFV